MNPKYFLLFGLFFGHTWWCSGLLLVVAGGGVPGTNPGLAECKARAYLLPIVQPLILRAGAARSDSETRSQEKTPAVVYSLAPSSFPQRNRSLSLFWASFLHLSVQHKNP